MEKNKNSIRSTVQTKIRTVREWPERNIPEKNRFQIRVAWCALTAILLYVLLWTRYTGARRDGMFLLADQHSDSGEAVLREKHGTWCTFKSNSLDGVPVYEHPGDTMMLSQVPEGKAVQALSETTVDGKDWSRIDFCGVRGWLPSSQLHFISDGEDYIKEGSIVYVNALTELGIKAYEEPSTNSGIVKEEIGYGSEFRVEELKNGWGKVVISGENAWINMFFMGNYPGDTWKVTMLNDSKGLNLRETPAEGVHINAKIPENTVLVLDEFHEGWGHTTYEEEEGWVKLKYLSPVSAK